MHLMVEGCGWVTKTYIRAFPSTTAPRAVQEILLHRIADAGAEFRTRAAQGTILRVARIGIVIARIASHQRLTLLVPARALPTRALQTGARVAARLSVGGKGVGRAGGVFARACFLRVALSGAWSADDARGGEVAVFAAVLVGVVADGGVFKLAGRGIAASVVPARCRAAAVAILAFLDNAVAALLAGDGSEAFVVDERGGVDAVAAESGANVADGAGAEVRDTFARRGVHDVLGAGVAGSRAERAALLCVDDLAVAAGGGVAIVHGAEGVSGFVGDDLPFGAGFGDDVGPADNFASGFLDTLDAELTKP